MAVGRGGFAVRPGTLDDAAAIARVQVDSWRTTYGGIVPQAHLDGMSYDGREASWQQQLGRGPEHGFTFVAVDDADELFGFASGGRERTGDAAFPGELYAIYLLQSAQRHGAGRALVAAVTAELTRRGMTALLLWVLAANRSARAFYERLDGRVARRRAILIGGVPLDEVAYGWVDTAALTISGRGAAPP